MGHGHWCMSHSQDTAKPAPLRGHVLSEHGHTAEQSSRELIAFPKVPAEL